ncbi:hypothetical protein LJC27_07155 [Christensenellaceae bacterium OttesenSCG-928-M15]|nr:hypothetical protein [Christensenellaceae bacterium OttesenSCG-928-M15]
MPLSGFEDEYSEFYTKIRLTVTDRNGNPIQGAVYGLYRMDNDQLVQYLTTDRYGVATSDDVPAETDYYLLEYSTPEGFQPNEERHEIYLTEVCAPSRVDVTAVYDPITGYIKVVKDDEDDNPIGGVGFYVYRVDGWELVDTIYTDWNGEAWTTELPYSSSGYELYEFYAPDDYVTGGYYSAYIREDGETETVYITNYRATGTARIHKTANDGRNVQGAVYSIYRIPQVNLEMVAVANADYGEWVCDITTNSSGYAYAYDLPIGEYYAIEKSVPSPYRLDETPQYFTIDYNDEWEYLSFENEVDGEAGRLRLLKTDDSENYLSGVVFGLYRAWDNKKLAELTTGATGIAEYYPLIPQDYYLVELSGKDGYEMVTDRIDFTVDGSGETVELVVENPKIRVFGKVKAVKSDDAGNAVPGTRIGVYCKWGILLEELVIGEDGTATSGILNAGTGYYLMELEGVPGYLANSEKYYFDITQNGAVVSVNIENPRISGGIKVTKYGDGEETLPGVVFGIYQNNRLVEMLTIGEDGTATSGILYYGDYELIELSTVEGYELIDTPIPFSISEDGVILELEVANPLIMGTITVFKVDDSGEEAAEDEQADEIAPAIASINGATPLPGAVFGLYNEQGQKLAELVTGDDGTASYTLPKGSFYLKELTAPSGFLLTDELIPFTIETQGQIVEKVIVNAQGYGAIKVIKSGDEGEESIPLPGVAFDVFREATAEKVGEMLTAEDGTATLELPLGRYYLIETSTVEGFQLLSGRVSFSLAEDGVTAELPIANQRIPAPENGGIRLTKISAADESPLSNAVFGVYDAATDEKIGELTTGIDGTASISLPASDYYLLEQTAPTGFLPIEDKIPVTVVEGVYSEITVENEPEEADPGLLRVIKHAEGSGERLSGARFGVYDASTDEKIDEITTGENGVASISLPEGDFYLLELAAPTGFQRITTPFSFHITAGETYKLTIANSPETTPVESGKVRFIKEDEDGNRLTGAVIGVYKSGTDEKIAELTVGKNGTVEYDLAAGDYYWKELRAPEGFSLLTDKNAFSIAVNKTREITVVNEALPTDTGTLLLIKKGAGTGEAISDAVFGVYLSSNNRKVGEITTDDSGEAEISLEQGSYYLKELSVPSPWVLESSKINFTIKKSGTTVTVEVSNTKGVGTLLLDKSSTEGNAVSGAVFTLYKQDGTRIAELISGKDGTATYELPVGNYYIVEKTAAVGFQLDSTRHSFTIKHNETRTVKVTNAPIQGTVEVYFKHVDGRELSPMKSLTDKIGTDYIKWMREKGYENMLINGYTLIRTDYPSSFVIIDGKLVVTLWYDAPKSTPPGTIEIPKTGGSIPAMPFVLSALCWMVAAFCAVTLVKGRKQPGLAMAGAPIMVEEPEPPAKPTPMQSTKPAKKKGKRKKGRR